MSASTPRFSIVVPAYNAASTLDAAISSVLAQQGFDAFELVITNDGSTDDTLPIAESYAARDPRVRVFSQPNAGAGAAISSAIERAEGEFCVQLGADDELLPDHCTTMSAFIDANPGYDIYASNAFRLHPDGRRTLYHTGPRFERVMSLELDDLLDAPQIFGGAAFCRELFSRVGGFRSDFYNEDYDFWLRAMIAGARHIYTPEPLALYRVRAGQKTADGIRMREDDIAILRDAVTSGGLSPAQVAHAERTVALLEKNVRFRRAVLRVLGERLSRPVFALAHRLAYAVRPHRRAR
jgi:glycosyltransferase involved in cell wall biosynthesis